MIDLIFDTETSDKVLHKVHYSDMRQPHPVQIGAVLMANGKEVTRMDTLVKCPVKISDGAFGVHKISNEQCEAEGMEPHEAYEKFFKMLAAADCLVAHNLSFDLKIMRTLWHRNQHRIKKRTEEQTQKLKNIDYICTMKTLTNILKLPGKYGYKWPKLEEAYKLLVDPKGFEGAHDAFTDVKACYALLGVIREKGYAIQGE